MLADVVSIIWVVMAGAMGYKRRARVELPSLILIALTLLISRFVGSLLGPSLAGIGGIGPYEASLYTSLVLWLALYWPLLKGWNKWNQWTPESGVRIELDELGNPVVKGAALQGIFGLLLGVVRGAILYVGVVSCIIALVPGRLYKDGRGTAVVHLDSKTMKWIKAYDPGFQKLLWTTRGLRSIQYLNTHWRARRSLVKTPAMKKIWQSEDIKALRKNRTLLNRAMRKRQGKKDPTLLLWLPAFQKAATSDATRKKLVMLAKAAPAPFDRKQKNNTKKTKRKKR